MQVTALDIEFMSVFSSGSHFSHVDIASGQARTFAKSQAPKSRVNVLYLIQIGVEHEPSHYTDVVCNRSPTR